MQERGFMQNIVIIAVLLAVVFLSQMPYFRPAVKDLFSQGTGANKKSGYVSKAQDWLKTNVYDRLMGAGGEVTKQKDAVQEKIVEEKNNLQEKSIASVKEFIAEKILQTLGVTPEQLMENQPTQLSQPVQASPNQCKCQN